MKKIFKTAVIFKILDYLTMKPIQNARIDLPPGYKTVAKNDGYFVVLGDTKPDFANITSPNYEQLSLSFSEIEDEMIIWLKTKKNSYSKLISCENNENKLAFAYKSQELRLLLDKTVEENEIILFLERPYNLEGRNILLQNRENGEIVQVLHQNKEKLTISSTKNSYPKIKTQVYLLFESEIDDFGNCIIQVPDDEDYQIIYH